VKIINFVVDDLITISEEFNTGEITKEELDIKLELLIQNLEAITINFSEAPLKNIDKRIKDSFNQLLFKTKHKAISCIYLLISTKNKKSYNSKLRWMVTNKLYFNNLNMTLTKSIESYIHRNGLLYCKEFQLFITGKVDESE
jgi:hypothetical protein